MATGSRLKHAIVALSLAALSCQNNGKLKEDKTPRVSLTPNVVPAEPSVVTLSPTVIEIQRPLPLGATILLVGDSLGVGMSHRFKELAVDCGYRPVTHVIGGTNTLQWHSWLKRDLDKYKPSLVLVVLGTNDAAQISRMKTENAHGRLVSLLDDQRYLWILPHKIDTRRIPNIDSMRDIIRSIASSHFDSSKIDVPLAPDKIHSSPLGYKTWMEAIWSHLDEEVTIRNCSK